MIYFKATNPNEVKAKIGIRKTRPMQIHMRRGEMYKKYELIHARLNAQKIKWIKFKHNNQLSNLPYCHMVFIHPINTDFSNNNNNSSRKYNITPLTIPQQMYVNYQWFNMTWKHTTSPTLICGVKQHTCIHNNQPYIYIYILFIFCGIWYYRDSTRYNWWNIHEHNNILHKYIQ